MDSHCIARINLTATKLDKVRAMIPNTTKPMIIYGFRFQSAHVLITRITAIPQ